MTAPDQRGDSSGCLRLSPFVSVASRRAASGGRASPPGSRTLRKRRDAPPPLRLFRVPPKDKWPVLLPAKEQPMREGAEPRGGGLVSVCVHRCHFSASERRRAEKLTSGLCVVIDGFRRLYSDNLSPGSSTINHYFADTTQGNPRPHRRHTSRPAPELFAGVSNSDTWLLFQP